jgi:hypothetical protein
MMITGGWFMEGSQLPDQKVNRLSDWLDWI